MLHFKCPGCSAGLRVQESRAGKLTACPSCGRHVRAPNARPDSPEIVEELPVVEAAEAAEAAEDDEGRPRRRRRRKPARPLPEDDEDAACGDFMTRNRFMGAVGVVLGLFFTGSALVAGLIGRVDLRNPLNNPYNAGGCFGLLLGVLLLLIGILYAVRG